jgi:hypothetical protein
MPIAYESVYQKFPTVFRACAFQSQFAGVLPSIYSRASNDCHGRWRRALGFGRLGPLPDLQLFGLCLQAQEERGRHALGRRTYFIVRFKLYLLNFSFGCGPVGFRSTKGETDWHNNLITVLNFSRSQFLLYFLSVIRSATTAPWGTTFTSWMPTRSLSLQETLSTFSTRRRARSDARGARGEREYHALRFV